MRGEHADVFLDGPERRSVCDLCQSRALNEGWLREGTVPPYEDIDSGPERKRSLFTRLRRRREPPLDAEPPIEAEEEIVDHDWVEPPARPREQPREHPREQRRDHRREQLREHRHVRAVPTSVEQKCAVAVEHFNSSEHPRTVAGVARSLGPPDVAVLAVQGHPSLVYVIVSWELCWYRYEVDLAEELPSVRTETQGSELGELSTPERQPNAVADEYGELAFAE